MSAVGVSPVTRSSASFVGSTEGFHSPLRQPNPRSQRPSGTEGAASATRATASSSERAPSRRISRRATDQVGKWTWASLKPGRTQRPPRSTRSGLGSAVSCVPTPPATHSPAIASARATGRLESIVLTTPFSRITVENLDVFDHVTIRVSDLDASRLFYDLVFAEVALAGLQVEGGHFVEWNDFSISQASAERPVTRRLHVGFVAASRAHVDGFWRTLTSAGYPDDGKPGLRPQYRQDYYGAFVLDPDGNSMEAVHHSLVPERTGVIDHVWLRTADLGAARRFYETIAPVCGFRIAGELDDRVGFGGSTGSFTLTEGEPTEHVHLAFPAPDRATVDEFHSVATGAGYRDNGAPGERRVYHPGYYGAYVLDPDGNNVEAVFHDRANRRRPARP